jgi:hypothetical protein
MHWVIDGLANEPTFSQCILPGGSALLDDRSELIGRIALEELVADAQVKIPLDSMIDTDSGRVALGRIEYSMR